MLSIPQDVLANNNNNKDTTAGFRIREDPVQKKIDPQFWVYDPREVRGEKKEFPNRAFYCYYDDNGTWKWLGWEDSVIRQTTIKKQERGWKYHPREIILKSQEGKTYYALSPLSQTTSSEYNLVFLGFA